MALYKLRTEYYPYNHMFKWVCMAACSSLDGNPEGQEAGQQHNTQTHAKIHGPALTLDCSCTNLGRITSPQCALHPGHVRLAWKGRATAPLSSVPPATASDDRTISPM